MTLDTLALDRRFDARVIPARQRARAADGRLREAVVLMALLNLLVWGGMIAATRGLIDVHQLADQAWAQGARWIAALPQVSVTISR
jgi:hypothetical protein